MAKQAIGIIEAKGLVSLIEASDAALKAADITMVGWTKIGSGLVTGFYAGEVTAVQVIPRPHDDLSGLVEFV